MTSAERCVVPPRTRLPSNAACVRGHRCLKWAVLCPKRPCLRHSVELKNTRSQACISDPPCGRPCLRGNPRWRCPCLQLGPTRVRVLSVPTNLRKCRAWSGLDSGLWGSSAAASPSPSSHPFPVANPWPPSALYADLQLLIHW